MFYFVVAVLAITAVVQAILLYENKNIEDFYIEEQRLAMKYQAELESRLARAEREVRLLRLPPQEVDRQILEAMRLANQEVDQQIDEAMRLANQEVDQQIDEAVRLANQERNINE